MRLLTILLLLLLPLCISAEPLEKTITVETDKNQLSTGETFVYKIKITGGFSDPEIKLPDFENFRVVGQQQSRNYSYQGKTAILQFNMAIILMAVNPGDYTIPPLELTDKNETFKSEAITVKVQGRPLKEKQKILPYIESGKDI